MKSKDRPFLEDSYDNNLRSRKKINHFRKAQSKSTEGPFEDTGITTDKAGCPINIGDFVLLKIGDRKNSVEGEVIDITRGNLLTIVCYDISDNGNVTFSNINSNRVEIAGSLQ